MKNILIAILFLLISNSAIAGFRCGTKIVKEGDSVSALLDKCGTPKHKYWATEDVGQRGERRSAKVMNYVYGRGRQNNMIVSVRGGKIIKIAVD